MTPQTAPLHGFDNPMTRDGVRVQKRQQGTDGWSRYLQPTDWLWAREAPSRDAQKQVRDTSKGLSFWQTDLGVGVEGWGLRQLKFVIKSKHDTDTGP